MIVFSPHPDDDVISMGGTLKRLVDQKHDVHVAYETSGNIAVGDEDMFRYVMLMDRIGERFGIDTEKYKEISAEIHNFLKDKKQGDIDMEIIRYLKGKIRQCEATTACNYMGVKPENIHFCELPFYETGTIKKGDLTQVDVDIIKKLIMSVQPHQIFVAGDLADPHGTHKVCTDAVLAAVDELLDEPFMKDCRIWMYRGAWAEWEIDHIEMAVPISPEELRSKGKRSVPWQRRPPLLATRRRPQPCHGTALQRPWLGKLRGNGSICGISSYPIIGAIVELSTPHSP